MCFKRLVVYYQKQISYQHCQRPITLILTFPHVDMDNAKHEHVSNAVISH